MKKKKRHDEKADVGTSGTTGKNVPPAPPTPAPDTTTVGTTKQDTTVPPAPPTPKSKFLRDTEEETGMQKQKPGKDANGKKKKEGKVGKGEKGVTAPGATETSSVKTGDRAMGGGVPTSMPAKSTESKDQLTSLSEEQVNALYDRFMDIMRTIARRERSRRVFTGLFDIFDFLATQVDTAQARHTARSTAWDITHDEHVYNTLKLAQEIFEEFTGNKTLDPFLRKMRRIVRIFRKDPESRDYFVNLRHFILDILKNPGLLDDERKVEDGRTLVRRGTHLSNRKLNRHINGAVQDLRGLIDNAKNDPTINNLRRDMKRLAHDVMLDADGNVAFKPEALDQLRLIIVSTLIQRMKLPLPPINYADDKLEYTITDAVLTIEDIVPDNVYIKEKGRLGVDLSNVREPCTDKATNVVKFVIKGINLHMPQCNLWFKRKKFPKIEDEGRANIDIGGRGVDIVVVIETFFKSADFFKVKRVWCDVHHLNLHFADTRHDFLYNTFFKLFSKAIKRNMQNSIERRIESNLEQLNHLLKKQVDKSKLPNTIAQRTITSKQ